MHSNHEFQGKCKTDPLEERRKFNGLSEALSILGFSEDQKGLIYRVLSSVLHLGNLYFHSLDDQLAEIANPKELRWVSLLLEVEYDLLKDMFSFKVCVIHVAQSG